MKALGDGVKEPSVALILNIRDGKVGRKRKEALADRAVSVGFRSVAHDAVISVALQRADFLSHGKRSEKRTLVLLPYLAWTHTASPLVF